MLFLEEFPVMRAFIPKPITSLSAVPRRKRASAGGSAQLVGNVSGWPEQYERGKCRNLRGEAEFWLSLTQLEERRAQGTNFRVSSPVF